MTALVPIRVPNQRDRIASYVAAFLRFHAGNSHHTARTYRPAIASWLDWCDRNGVDPLDAVPAQGQLWMAEQRDQYANTTRAMRLSAVRSWYEWLEEQGVGFRRNPAKWRSGHPKPNPKPTQALTVDQRNRVLAAADREHQHRNPLIARHGRRNAAMVWVLFTTGIRVAELLAADIEDLGQDAGHNVLHLIGKGSKRHTTPLIPPTWQRIQTYRATRADASNLPAVTVGARPRRPLFVTETGNRVQPNAVRAMLRRLAHDAGLPAEVVAAMSPHVTRATYVTLSLATGKSLQEVQRAVGHASPITTQGYDRSHLSHDRHPSYALMADLNIGTPEGDHP